MQIIRELINEILEKLSLESVEHSVSHPKEESHGDYSSNVAMILAKKVGKNPRELAQQIVEEINKVTNLVKIIEKVEVAGPGFINFYLKSEFLVGEAKKALKHGYGKNNRLNSQQTYVEFTDPNPFKEFHIGHLMSNAIGEALCRIFEANGAMVKRANYQGDIGLHVAKSIWGWQKLGVDFKGSTLKEKIAYLGQAYAHGAGEYETDETAKGEMNLLNAVIYKRSDAEINQLYDLGRSLSLEYFETIYQRLGTKFEEYFFESEEGPKGLKVVEEGLKKGVLEIGESGSVVFKGEQYGLHTRVFRNKLGLPTYEAKELALPRSKYERWAYDKSFIVTANEIDEYFKVLLKVLSFLSPELGDKTTHLSHGVMKLTTGKMSSRSGKVVTGEGLLNELQEVVLNKMSERSFDSTQDKDMIADQVAVGALKYTVLKQALGGDIVYDPIKMTNMDGDTGPYIQYTYARAKSILAKFATLLEGEKLQGYEPCNLEELGIMRWIARYPEVIAEAGAKFAPHLVAGYIYELATRFNSFYNGNKIGDDPRRLALTQMVANVLSSGLGVLGIQAPEKM